MNREIRDLLSLQSGVIGRDQALASGLAPHDVRRLLRRREWAHVHPGVYVDHTGPPTWHQRAWAAVRHAWPSALSHDSALRAADGPGRRDRRATDPIHIAVSRTRSFAPPPGVVVHYLADLDAKVYWNGSPPRVRMEHAVVDVAAEASDNFAAVAVIADAVQARRTTAPRIRAALDSRSRIARRAFLEGVVTDVGAGTCSVLEHAYLRQVERRHGLPRAGRQVRDSARGPVFRDVVYDANDLIVELDGRLFHDSAAARDRDLERDLDASIDGRLSVRLGWGQVVSRPCATAAKIGALLAQRGWAGVPLACPSCDSRDLVPARDTARRLSA